VENHIHGQGNEMEFYGTAGFVFIHENFIVHTLSHAHVRKMERPNLLVLCFDAIVFVMLPQVSVIMIVVVIQIVLILK
jgi:hypothetical protein